MTKKTNLLKMVIILILLVGIGCTIFRTSEQYILKEIVINSDLNELGNILSFDKEHVLSAIIENDFKVQPIPSTILSVKIRNFDGNSFLNQDFQFDHYVSQSNIVGKLNNDFFSFYVYDDYSRSEPKYINVFGSTIGQPCQLLYEAKINQSFKPQFLIHNNELCLFLINEFESLVIYFLESNLKKEISLSDTNTNYRFDSNFPIGSNGRQISFLAKDTNNNTVLCISDGEQIIDTIKLLEEEYVSFTLLDDVLFASSFQNFSYKLYSIDYKNDSDWHLIKTLEGFFIGGGLSNYFINKMDDLFANQELYEVRSPFGSNIKEIFLAENLSNYQQGNYQAMWEYIINNVGVFIKKTSDELLSQKGARGMYQLEYPYDPTITTAEGFGWQIGYFLRASYYEYNGRIESATAPTMVWVYNPFDNSAFDYEINYPIRTAAIDSSRTRVVFTHSFKLLVRARPTGDTPAWVHDFPAVTDSFSAVA